MSYFFFTYIINTSDWETRRFKSYSSTFGTIFLHEYITAENPLWLSALKRDDRDVQRLICFFNTSGKNFFKNSVKYTSDVVYWTLSNSIISGRNSSAGSRLHEEMEKNKIRKKSRVEINRIASGECLANRLH